MPDTLFTDEAMVIVDDREEVKSVQFWGAGRVAGFAGIYELAGMSTSNVSHAFYITHGCPESVADQAWAVYLDFARDGIMPTPTHTVSWQFGKPDFTPVATPEGATPNA